MRIVHKTQVALWPTMKSHHILTFAEEGFAPLSIHAEAWGLGKAEIVAFVKEARVRNELGSLHPRAPLSAVPRWLIRETRSVRALCESFKEFLAMNSQAIHASRILCDLRAPHVQPHVLRAIREAFNASGASALEEVMVVE